MKAVDKLEQIREILKSRLKRRGGTEAKTAAGGTCTDESPRGGESLHTGGNVLKPLPGTRAKVNWSQYG